ncbi:MAG: VanW family protein, partial [Ruminococcus sp.]|nr:VanW family protein [Ruminococcus sp.]
MENNNKRNIADTMEINSIIAETKNRYNTEEKTVKGVPVENTRNYANQHRSNIEDNFVLYDDEVDITDVQRKPEKKKNPKAKKRALVITVVSLIIVMILAGGYCIYRVFGEFKYASNIYVNDIAIGGMNEREAQKVLEDEEEALASKINIIVNAEDKKTTLTKNNLTYSFNTDEVLKKAREYSEDTLVPTGEQKYKLEIKFDQTGANAAAKTVADEIDQEAKDAVVTKFDSSKKGASRFTIEDSAKGISIKQEAFAKQLTDFVKDGKVSGVIDAEADLIEPKYSKEYLQSNIKKLSSFTTTSTNNSNGNANMKLSLSKCNNSIINPGDVWSFNKCTGDSNQTSNGYLPAGVIVEGKSTTGVGGGICQSSTTIYNATLLCGMEVVERECHYYKSVYVDAGRDATVDYGNIDLKMKNIFDYQLFMECYMDGAVLHCNMYGIENPEFDKITISSSVSSYFSGGFRAETSRTYFKGNSKVKTEALPSSAYYTSAPSSGNDSNADADSNAGSSANSQTQQNTNNNTSSGTSSGSDGGSTDPGAGGG